MTDELCPLSCWCRQAWRHWLSAMRWTPDDPGHAFPRFPLSDELLEKEAA